MLDLELLHTRLAIEVVEDDSDEDQSLIELAGEILEESFVADINLERLEISGSALFLEATLEGVLTTEDVEVTDLVLVDTVGPEGDLDGSVGLGTEPREPLTTDAFATELTLSPTVCFALSLSLLTCGLPSESLLDGRVELKLDLTGAFDCFNRPRSQLMAVYETMVEQSESDKRFQANGQLSLFDSVLKVDEKANFVTYPNIQEYAPQQKLKMEKEVLGIYVSGHPLDKYRDKMQRYTVDSSKFEGTPIESSDGEETTVIYDQITDGQNCVCGGIISAVKKLHSRKTNKDMAVVSIEDFNGTFECMLFPKIYQEYRDRLSVDKLVTVDGRISIREGESPIVMVEKIEFWQDTEKPEASPAPAETQVHKLCLKFDLTNESLKDEVFKILEFYPGDVPVVAKCTKTNRAYGLPFKVDASIALQNELMGLIDEDSVKLI